MFFLARSAFCIGLVAFMLPASQEPGTWTGLAEQAKATAADHLDALCSVTSSGCAEARVAKLVLSKSIGTGSSFSRPQRSINTLRPADFVPAWSGPAPRS